MAQRPPGGQEPERRSRVLLSVLEDLREERERLARETDQRRLAEQRFRATIEAAPIAMVMIDREGRIVLVNAQTEELFGYTRRELLDGHLELLVPEEFRNDHPRLRRDYFASPSARRMGAGRDLFARRRDGTRFPVEIGLSPVATDEGLFVLSAIADITERKALEEAQGQLTRELERRVRERTAELAVARDQAQAASRAKSDFLANMSHEIRTPLNAVIGLTEVLSRTRLDPLQREHVETVLGSAESLLTVLNDILDFSKIEAGKLEVERVRFDLQELVDGSLKSQAGRAQVAGVELVGSIEPGLAIWRWGDPGRLRQVLSNLLNNAVKFTTAGEVELRVEQAPGGEPGRLRFSVRDTGVGIEPDAIERLFDPFEQADSSTTRRFGGTGLGLSISRQLVELMQGAIGAASALGVGSTFHFEVPLEAAGGPAPRPAALAGRAVLVVDGHATTRARLRETLLAWDLEAHEAGSADEALAQLRALVRADRAPLALIEAELAGGGRALAARIRGDAELAETPLLLASSQAADPGPECAGIGLDPPLTKPISQGDLCHALLRAGGHRAPEPEQDAPAPGPSAAEDTLAGLRVLLVEDSAANRKVARALLADSVARLDMTENGVEALAALSANDYDVVLMDVQMPEMDGLEAARAVRAAEDGSGRHQPIVAMTAHALEGDRVRCLEAGMDDYVAKPIRRAQLFEAIARVVGAQRDRVQERERGKTGFVS